MKNKKFILNFIVIALLTAFALWFALKDNYKEVIDAISKMSIFSLFIILSWGIVFTAVWGMVYYILARKYVKDYRPFQGIIVSLVGTFFSGITPSATGGQFGQVYILNKQGVKVSDAASLLWADFIIYQTTMMIYVTALFLLKFKYYQAQSAWFNIILAGYGINVVVISFLYTMALFPKVYIYLSKYILKFLCLFHISKNPEKLLESWNEQITNFTKEIKVLSKDKKTIIDCALVNVIRLTLYFSLPFVISIALHIPVEPKYLLDMITLSSFVTMANSFIPVPGSSGGTEVVFTLLFKRLTHDLTGAVMVLWRFSTFHIVLLLGGITFLFTKNYYEK